MSSRRSAVRALIATAGAAGSLVVMAAPVGATVHPLANSECSSANAADPARTQNPRGITSEGHEPGYTDPDPDHAVEAQPIVAILDNTTSADLAAFKGEACP